MSPDAKKDSLAERFTEAYNRLGSKALLAVEREVFGANVGVNGYTTIAQADDLAERLGLHGGVRLLDVGAGQGWPGIYLSKKTGCHVVVTDLPVTGLRTAATRARRQRLERRSAVIQADGARLPFRPRSFDAVVHTDVL